MALQRRKVTVRTKRGKVYQRSMMVQAQAIGRRSNGGGHAYNSWGHSERMNASEFLMKHGTGILTRAAITGGVAGAAQAHVHHVAARRAAHSPWRRDADTIGGVAGLATAAVSARSTARLLSITSRSMREDLNRSTTGARLAGWALNAGVQVAAHVGSFKAVHAYHSRRSGGFGG